MTREYKLVFIKIISRFTTYSLIYLSSIRYLRDFILEFCLQLILLIVKNKTFLILSKAKMDKYFNMSFYTNF